jgi:hypothetical protein
MTGAQFEAPRFKPPAAPAVKREAEEDWGRVGRGCRRSIICAILTGALANA